MTLTNTLDHFPLIAVLQMMSEGRKSGHLALFNAFHGGYEAEPCYHIWFRRGQIVAAANSLDGRGLMSSILAKKWLTQSALERFQHLTPAGIPLGLTLQTEGVLNEEQRQHLFKQQLQPFWPWFGHEEGRFELNFRGEVPMMELTGLSVPVLDIVQAGLRSHPNWPTLSSVLPAPTARMRLLATRPTYPLNELDGQIWTLMAGGMTLEAIAQHLQVPVGNVQQAVFPLMMAGLVVEVSAQPAIATSALPDNLINFCQRKVLYSGRRVSTSQSLKL